MEEKVIAIRNERWETDLEDAIQALLNAAHELGVDQYSIEESAKSVIENWASDISSNESDKVYFADGHDG